MGKKYMRGFHKKVGQEPSCNDGIIFEEKEKYFGMVLVNQDLYMMKEHMHKKKKPLFYSYLVKFG